MKRAVEEARQKKNAYKARALSAEAAIGAIRRLHRERYSATHVTVCASCEKRWPCPTIHTLEGVAS